MSKLRVWHIPQVPMKAFHVEVETPEEAIKVLDILADYDLFQFENRVKPDYCNAQGLEEWDAQEGEWCEWYSEDGLDIEEYLCEMEEKIVPLTNADHLQELSDEEKAHLLTRVFYQAAQQTNAEHYILEWLKKPVGE